MPLTSAQKQACKAHLCPRQPGIHAEGGPVCRLGLVELTCLRQGIAIRLMHLGRGACAGLCAREEIDGFLGVTPPDPGGSEQIVDVRAIGLDPANRFGLLLGLARVSEREERLPEQEADLDGPPVPLSRSAQLPGRVGVPALGVIRAAERVESRSEGRVQLEGILQIDDCLVILAFLEMARAPIEVLGLLDGRILSTREEENGSQDAEDRECRPVPQGGSGRSHDAVRIHLLRSSVGGVRTLRTRVSGDLTIRRIGNSVST